MKKNKKALFWTSIMAGGVIIGLLIIFIGYSAIKQIGKPNFNIKITIWNVGAPFIIGLGAFPFIFLVVRFGKNSISKDTLASSSWKSKEELNREFPWIKIQCKKN